MSQSERFQVPFVFLSYCYRWKCIVRAEKFDKSDNHYQDLGENEIQIGQTGKDFEVPTDHRVDFASNKSGRTGTRQISPFFVSKNYKV